MQQQTSQIIEKLKQSYQTIAKDFSDSRSQPWPEFKILNSYITKGSKVLDLGCGNGRFFGYLRQEGKLVDYTGVDFVPEFLTIAKAKYPHQDFVEQNITELDLPHRYDRIVCIAAFHHIPTARLRKKTLKAMINHLEEDGLILISVWNLWQWKYRKFFLKSFLSFLSSAFHHDPRDVSIPFGKGKIARYYHAFVPFEMPQLLRSAGLSIEHCQISRHNSLFVCRKSTLAGVGNPLFVNGKRFAEQLHKSSALATCKPQS
jgi:SAM-dependent methyltransferase